MFIKELEEILKKVVTELGYDSSSVRLIKSNRPELCDYQCDDTFKLAKMYKKNPLEIGTEIADKLNQVATFSDYFKTVEFVKPGFITLTVSDSFINKYLTLILNSGNLNITKPIADDMYFIDYGGPNIAKPLHVGHLRPAIIGESLKRIINFKGYKTITDVHLGDYGLQIGQVIYGILKDNIKKEDITLAYLEATYPKMSALCKSDEEVLNACQQITKELQDGNELYQQLWKTIYEISLNDIKRIYDNLDVSFDLWQGESDSYQYIEEMIKYLDNKGVTKLSEGAKIIEVKEENDNKEIPPFLLQKSNGAYLYGTTDLASIYERMNKYNPNYILYCTDERQQLHFEQVFRAAKKGELIKETKLEHIWFGTMNGPDGKPFKTRSGDMLKLDDLFAQVKEGFIGLKETNKDMNTTDINKIVNAIILFADLQNNRERNYIFDISKFSDVIGKTGPYILYTYLRLSKLLSTQTVDLNNNIYNQSDRDLRLKLMELELSVDSAFNERMPSYIADYVYDICVSANTFYQTNRVNDQDDQTKKEQWIIVLALTNRIIEKLLGLLLIKIPSVM